MPKHSVINGTNLETIFQDLPKNQNAQLVTPTAQSQLKTLSHIRVFVCAVLCPLNILLVYQHLDTLLDNGDRRSKACLKKFIIRLLKCTIHNFNSSNISGFCHNPTSTSTQLQNKVGFDVHPNSTSIISSLR